MSYIDRLKTLNSEKCLPSLLPKLPKGGEGQPKGAFDSFDSSLSAHFQKIEPSNDEDTPRRLWLIHHADGRLISHSFTPPATETEVRAWYPKAITIELEDDDE